MGLDGVELVLTVEERYQIRLPDAACSRVGTVADLAALIITQLPTPTGACPTARTFFRLRKTFVRQWGIHRREVRPDTPLETLFPRPLRQRRWETLAEEHALPSLTLSAAALRTFAALAILLLLAWCAAIVAFVLKIGPWWGVWAVVAFVMPWLSTLALVHSLDRWATEIPEGYVTLGDLVRRSAAEPLPADSGARLLAEQEILEEVRGLTAAQMNLPLEKVRPESRFAIDLGMD